MRELLINDGYWNIVDCELEAHCILEYVFVDDDGRDYAYLRIKDRSGKVITTSPTVSASDWIPSHAGQESARKLYEKHIKKLKDK
jgi:hypothetical protein